MSFFSLTKELNYKDHIENMLYNQCYITTDKSASTGQPIKALIYEDKNPQTIDLGGGLEQQKTQAKIFLESIESVNLDINKSFKGLYLIDTDNSMKYKVLDYFYVGDSIICTLEFIKHLNE